MSDFSVSDLEQFVKSHMKHCQPNANATLLAEYKRTLGAEWMMALDNKLMYGDC